MLKKRLIFVLLYQEENFYLSRNFQLQKVGNLDWLKKNYDFSLIAKSIDELIILDVSRKKNDVKKFTQILKRIIENCFIPVSVGGKINHLDIAKEYIDAGADKLVINSNPCISYNMEDNTTCLTLLVLAHAAYGHNHFFKNNYLFKQWTNADSIVDYLIFL